MNCAIFQSVQESIDSAASTFLEADFGQSPEHIFGVEVSRQPEPLCHADQRFFETG